MGRAEVGVRGWFLGRLAAAAAAAAVVALITSLATQAQAQPLELRIDFSRTNGVVRPLHGLNKGPIAVGGTVDLSTYWAELSAPLTRLHDCQWPYPDVVDVHAIFRAPDADPSKAENYDFALTDAYLAPLAKLRVPLVYRLGESIEHGPVKRFVHPPRDPQNWARVCLGIVRHYNEGWAGGTRYGIRYWEIWNEPENRPAMWTGTDEQYLQLYQAAATALKGHDPNLKVGGPALGFSGELKNGQFVPSAFVTNFLTHCRTRSIPLDFFSWHCYTDDPAELTARARGVRRILDTYGFARTESHLNEWNLLPGNTWDPFDKSASPEARQQFYERMGGAEGAAFTTLALTELQHAPLDVSNFYHGELSAFGLFNEFGVPNRVFYALRAFAGLVRLGDRVATTGATAGQTGVLAATGRKKSAILISNYRGTEDHLHLEVAGMRQRAALKVWITDLRERWRETRSGEVKPNPQTGSVSLDLFLPAPGVALLELEPF